MSADAPHERRGSRERPVRSGVDASLALPLAGLVIGVWAVLPPYVGWGVDTAPSTELVDHVVPGAVVVVVSLASLCWRRRAVRGGLMFSCGLVVILAGLWMVATHLPLIGQATNDEASWAAVVHHSLPGLLVLCLGLGWAGSYWSDAGNAQ